MSMKINFMRNVDYFVGVPVAFVLTMIRKIFSRLLQKVSSKPKNILFIELSEMGSAILADPAMRKAEKVFDAQLFFCIFSKNKDSLFLLNTIDKKNIFVIREDYFINLLIDTIKFLFWARQRKIDTVIDLELFSRFTAVLTGLSGAKNKVGFFAFYQEGLYRGDLLTHKVVYNPHIHISKNFMALVHSLMADKQEIPYSKTVIKDEDIVLEKVFFNEDQKQLIWDRIKRLYPLLDKGKNLILINANASDLLPQRRWPMPKFANLIKNILEYDAKAVVLLTGSPSEYPEMQNLKNMVENEKCINFTGRVTLAELPILYSISKFMVTNDSGPGHFSAITDLPTFILFGPETPKLYGSLGDSIPIYANLACSPCVNAFNHRKTPCTDNVCLQVITEEEVFEKIKEYLKS